METSNEEKPRTPKSLEAASGRYISGSGVRPGAGTSSAHWEIPIPPRVSRFLVNERSGARAFNPSSVTSARTQGINAVRAGRFSEGLIGACRRMQRTVIRPLSREESRSRGKIVNRLLQYEPAAVSSSKPPLRIQESHLIGRTPDQFHSDSSTSSFGAAT